MAENHDVKAMFLEVQQKIVRQNTSIDALKDHARTVLGSSSIIISLLGALQIFSGAPDQGRGLYVGIIAAIALLYIVLMVLTVWILSPLKYSGPIELEMQTLGKAFLNKDERDVIKMQISAYLNAIHKNQPMINQREKLTRWISIILPIIVILVIAAGLVPIYA